MPRPDPDGSADAPGRARTLPSEGERVDVVVEKVVADGLGLGHLDDGRVALVTGALPGEEVIARVERAKRDVVHATTIDVRRPSADRVVPPCPFLHEGCGGCDLQHARVDAQAGLKRSIVVDALQRIARLTDAPVGDAIALAPWSYRTTVRGLVTRDGRVALRRAGTHDPIAIDACLVAHPLVDEIIRNARFPGARDVTIRAGARTGERLVIVDRAAGAARGIPDGVMVVDRRAAGDHAVHEIVDEVRFRISGPSFFQSHADAPSVLAHLAREHLGRCDTLFDIGCGVGLFAALVDAESVVGIDTSATAVRDARHNLAAIGRPAVIRRASYTDSLDVTADAVVADPPRDGLGRDGVHMITSAGATRAVLVSCDPAGGARDIRLLLDAGWTLDGVTPVDQFPQTSHVEMVSAFTT